MPPLLAIQPSLDVKSVKTSSGWFGLFLALYWLCRSCDLDASGLGLNFEALFLNVFVTNKIDSDTISEFANE